MKIGFVVNEVATEKAVFTTTRLAMTAVNMGHGSYILGVGDLVYAPDGSIHAHARSVAGETYESLEDYMDDLQGDDVRDERILVDDLDVLLLRNDPSDDAVERAWEQTSGILFSQLAAKRGVIFLNDPVNLANAINKPSSPCGSQRPQSLPINYLFPTLFFSHQLSSSPIYEKQPLSMRQRIQKKTQLLPLSLRPQWHLRLPRLQLPAENEANAKAP